MQSIKTKARQLKATYVGRPVEHVYILHVDCCWDNCDAASECIHGMKDFEQDKNATCCKNIGKYRSSQSLFRTDQKVAYK